MTNHAGETALMLAIRHAPLVSSQQQQQQHANGADRDVKARRHALVGAAIAHAGGTLPVRVIHSPSTIGSIYFPEQRRHCTLCAVCLHLLVTLARLSVCATA